MKTTEVVIWHPVIAVEALIRGKWYKIVQPSSKEQAVNVYCGDEFIGPARSIEDAKDSIERGLC